MEKSTSSSEPNIVLTCIEGAKCTVYFEPWGHEIVLKQEDVFRVFSAAFSTGDVEVSYTRGGITLGFTSDAPITVTDQAGRVLLVI